MAVKLMICIRLLDEISVFMRKKTEKDLMTSLLAKDDCIAQIENYYRRIEASIASFQVFAILTQTVSSLNLRLLLGYADLSSCRHSRVAVTKRESSTGRPRGPTRPIAQS
jgi:hypothetical protein